MYNVSHSGFTDEKVYTNHFNHDLVTEGLIILLVWMIVALYIKPHHALSTHIMCSSECNHHPNSLVSRQKSLVWWPYLWSSTSPYITEYQWYLGIGSSGGSATRIAKYTAGVSNWSRITIYMIQSCHQQYLCLSHGEWWLSILPADAKVSYKMGITHCTSKGPIVS